MNKRIIVYHLPDVQDFLNGLNEKVRNKISTIIDKTENGFTGDWFKKMKGSDDIWEFSIDFNGTFYRLLSFWDTEDPEHVIVVSAVAFKKKTNKTPMKEIRKAEVIKKEYFKN
jgi:phage-related protein